MSAGRELEDGRRRRTSSFAGPFATVIAIAIADDAALGGLAPSATPEQCECAGDEQPQPGIVSRPRDRDQGAVQRRRAPANERLISRRSRDCTRLQIVTDAVLLTGRRPPAPACRGWPS